MSRMHCFCLNAQRSETGAVVCICRGPLKGALDGIKGLKPNLVSCGVCSLSLGDGRFNAGRCVRAAGRDRHGDKTFEGLAEYLWKSAARFTSPAGHIVLEQNPCESMITRPTRRPVSIRSPAAARCLGTSGEGGIWVCREEIGSST